ncbi:MAG: hypothetical protein WC438_00280 [Candidatus Pacearchaeota archaeon]
MKREKKHIINLFTIIFLIVIFMNYVSASYSGTPCSLTVNMINQDPYPAVPNEYVDVVFQVSGVSNTNCEGTIFELIPTYPFSLDGSDAVKVLEGSTWTSNSKKDWMIPYKLRIDKDALDGDNEIEIYYTEGDNTPKTQITKIFNITIQDSRTSFDAVIQETSGSDVSIAIANVGKYAANSVIVKIPEQDSFTTSGTNGQMVGNLESGDYTLVGFTITKKMGMPNDFKNKTSDTNIQTNSDTLKFDIYYTDNIGERRVVNMELPLQIAGNSSMAQFNGNFPGRKTSSWWSNWYILLIILICVIIFFFIYKRYPRQTKDFLNKLKSKLKKTSEKEEEAIIRDFNKVSAKIPDWVKNSKTKEKK